MVRGDQRVARECYSASMNQKAIDNIYLDDLEMCDKVNTRPEPSEELELIPLDENHEHLAYIGSKLAEDLRSLLTHFLRQNKDVFAWTKTDMGGIDPTIITHRLNVNPSFKPVKQKRRSFAPERQKAINEEVGKLLQAGAIREVEYPEWFQILREYNMKLNLAKCAFGVSAGKFLGFIVNSRGIEANPDKIKVVLDMPPPSSIKEVQRLTGRIAALSRFVSRASDKCQPFFQVLKKAFQWDANCEEVFSALKTYLSSPPILVSPSEGELLTLYLAVSDFSTSIVLVKDKDRVQHPVYYCSRALIGAEERYPRMEKSILALVTTARKLRPYFQAHTIEIPTEYPMKQVLHKLETSGRLMKWAIELSEFDIRYKPKTAIKGLVLADFVMEFTSTEPAKNIQTMTDLPIWRLSVDGAANARGSGAGLILTSPEGIDIEYVLRLRFQASNNEAEYEAVIAGLNLAYSMEVDQLEVCIDSQLVVRQIEDT